jgi:GDP-4-dehydro-6-deoxy-D-mannose reductase
VVPHSLLLTGSRGFVGRHLRAALGRAFPQAVVHEAAFDMTDPAGIRAGLRAAQPDACIHLAAVSAIAAARQQPELAWQVNLTGTLDLARAIMDLVPECRLLFASTADAYGRSFAAGTALDEGALLAPMNTYAAAKAAADLALGALAADGLHAIRLRLFNHTGAGQSEAFVVAAFARQVARVEAGLQPPDLQVGALESRRDFLDVRDVCDAYVACLRQADELAAGTILNIAAGTPRRIGDILDDLLALSGIKVAVKPDAARLRPSDIATAVGDAALARRLLGWQPRIPWEQTLADVLADWRLRVRQPGTA